MSCSLPRQPSLWPRPCCLDSAQAAQLVPLCSWLRWMSDAVCVSRRRGSSGAQRRPLLPDPELCPQRPPLQSGCGRGRWTGLPPGLPLQQCVACASVSKPKDQSQRGQVGSRRHQNQEFCALLVEPRLSFLIPCVRVSSVGFSPSPSRKHVRGCCHPETSGA